jgi:hypothetical protein
MPLFRLLPLSPPQTRHLRPIAVAPHKPVIPAHCRSAPQTRHSGHMMLSKAMPLFCRNLFTALLKASPVSIRTTASFILVPRFRGDDGSGGFCWATAPAFAGMTGPGGFVLQPPAYRAVPGGAWARLASWAGALGVLFAHRVPCTTSVTQPTPAWGRLTPG